MIRLMLFMVSLLGVGSAMPVSAQVACDPLPAMEGPWTSDGPFQGLWMARVSSGEGNDILFSCDIGADIGSSMRVCLNGMTPASPRLKVAFEGEAEREIELNYHYRGQFSLRGGLDLMANEAFDALVADLRTRSGSVTFSDEAGNSADFTLSGSSKALAECPASRI